MKKLTPAVLFITFFSYAYGVEIFSNNSINEKCLSGNCKSKIITAILKSDDDLNNSSNNFCESKIKNCDSINNCKNCYRIRKFQSRCRCR